MLSLLSAFVRRQDEDDPPPDDYVPAHHASPVVAFIIGLAIVTLASVLNAAGLNLTKLDHVRALNPLLGVPNIYIRPATMNRFGRVRFRRVRGGRIGLGRFGCLGCCFICAFFTL